ncbi:MAG: hypothetical protein E5W94_11455 [Mesorhizobium sp.]|nr:MAG: hypothetical protein E5W94_11455 [Mesorhizobium sp.]
MMTPKHTPGPWEAGSERGYAELNGVQIRDRVGLVLAVAIGDVPELDSKANARLIAAAPELLAALKAVVRVADRNTDEFDLARAAIANAEDAS